MNGQTILIGLAVYVIFCLAVWAWLHYRKYPHRRFNDYGSQPILEDGQPGGSRGRVWSEKQRAKFRRNRELRKLRVIQ